MAGGGEPGRMKTLTAITVSARPPGGSVITCQHPPITPALTTSFFSTIFRCRATFPQGVSWSERHNITVNNPYAIQLPRIRKETFT